MLSSRLVQHLFPNFYSIFRTPHRGAALLAVGVCAAGVVVWGLVRRPVATAEAVEEARRRRLARAGRLTDGNLVDTTTFDGRFLAEAARPETAPRMLLYRYRIAGVAYEAVQDVSGMESLVLGLRVDLPIQVRYDAGNPADSIVVAETWCGLRYGRDEEGLATRPSV